MLASAFMLSTACSHLPDWLGAGEDDLPLPGERISVIDSSINLVADPALATETITAPDSKINFDSFKTYPVGEPAVDKYVLATSPAIADGKIFIIDGDGNVIAYKQDTMVKLWTNKVPKDHGKKLPGGGVVYANGIVYATRGNGEVIAISTDGTEIWKKNLGAPIRKNPAIGEEKLFVATSDNQLFALSLVDGSTVWRHSGSAESTINYGSPAPAFKDGSVVVAYSSGEVFGLNALRGSEQWAETISSGAERRRTAATFVDVSATPVLVDGICYIGSQNGTFIAFNTGSGYRIWEQRIGAVEYTPAVLDKFIFVIGDNTRLAALNRFDGKVKWSVALPPRQDKKIAEKWAGPVIAGDKIIAASSEGRMAIYDLNTGELTGLKKSPPGVFTLPVISGNNLYILNKDAELAVF